MISPNLLRDTIVTVLLVAAGLALLIFQPDREELAWILLGAGGIYGGGRGVQGFRSTTRSSP